ncbi:MAG: HAMP domain-containing histidine kinase [Lachnospiraceae bacterium]|nr:HAMP domain-containing histidine kinase [Lachnospiraceae bacterium]
MIDRLRKKVFWSIFLSASGVLFVVLLTLNILSFTRNEQKAKNALSRAEMLLSGEQEPGPGGPPRMPGGRKDNTMPRPWEMEEFTIVESGEEGPFLILGDADFRRDEITETVLVSLASFVCASALFAVMAHILAKRIVAPTERAMKLQQQFVADASHELKTPLTVIEANTTVLEKSMGENRWLTYIRDGSRRMSELVAALLQLSRLDEEAEAVPVPEQKPFDAAEAAMECALPLESAAFERHLTLETELPDSLQITAAEEDYRQIVTILLDNAIKHSAESGEITLRMEQCTMKQGRRVVPAVRTVVRNTGSEIPAEALPHLFERFYKADASREHTDGGFGLGLSIAKGLAERNRGSIRATSSDNSTEFILELPV